MIEFKAWPKIVRSDKICFVASEKIDGTNAAIHFYPHPEDSPAHGMPGYVVAAQSRTRLITVGDDNFGFAAWVDQNADSLFRDLGYGLHYGEWFGAGIQRKYGLTEKRFALFNTTRWAEKDGHFATPRLTVVPVLYRGGDLHMALSMYGLLKQGGSAIVPGFMNPEGIVVRELATGASWKLTDAPAPKGPKDKDGNAL